MTADRRDPTNPFAPTERQGWMDSSPINRRTALLHVGFAKGNYMCRCDDCGLQFQGDKFAYRCRPCAEAALQAHGQDAKPSEETTRAALVEKVADAFAKAWDDHGRVVDGAATAIDLIRAEVLEEAAKVADALEDSLATEWREGRKCDSHLEGKSDGAGEVAAAIRAMKEKA